MQAAGPDQDVHLADKTAQGQSKTSPRMTPVASEVSTKVAAQDSPSASSSCSPIAEVQSSPEASPTGQSPAIADSEYFVTGGTKIICSSSASPDPSLREASIEEPPRSAAQQGRLAKSSTTAGGNTTPGEEKETSSNRNMAIQQGTRLVPQAEGEALLEPFALYSNLADAKNRPASPLELSFCGTSSNQTVIGKQFPAANKQTAGSFPVPKTQLGAPQMRGGASSTAQTGLATAPQYQDGSAAPVIPEDGVRADRRRIPPPQPTLAKAMLSGKTVPYSGAAGLSYPSSTAPGAPQLHQRARAKQQGGQQPTQQRQPSPPQPTQQHQPSPVSASGGPGSGPAAAPGQRMQSAPEQAAAGKSPTISDASGAEYYQRLHAYYQKQYYGDDGSDSVPEEPLLDTSSAQNRAKLREKRQNAGLFSNHLYDANGNYIGADPSLLGTPREEGAVRKRGTSGSSSKKRKKTMLEYLLRKMQKPEVVLLSVWWAIMFALLLFLADLWSILVLIWKPLLFLVSVPVVCFLIVLVVTL